MRNMAPNVGNGKSVSKDSTNLANGTDSPATNVYVPIEVGKDGRTFLTMKAPALSAPAHAKALAFDFFVRQLKPECKTLTTAAIIAAVSNHFGVSPHAAVTVSKATSDGVKKQFLPGVM